MWAHQFNRANRCDSMNHISGYTFLHFYVHVLYWGNNWPDSSNVCKVAFSCAGNMEGNTLARPLHWGLLIFCAVSLCSQIVSTGNQSSRGQTGRCRVRLNQTSQSPPRGTHYGSWSPALSARVQCRQQQQPGDSLCWERSEYGGNICVKILKEVLEKLN